MPDVASWWFSPEYQSAIEGFRQQDGRPAQGIMTIVYSQSRLEKTYPQYAVYLRTMPAFSFGGTLSGVPLGLIAFEEVIEADFAPSERAFILAHEYAHIVLNHCPVSAAGGFARKWIDDRISECDSVVAKAVFRLLLECGCALVRGQFTVNSELEADKYAVGLVGNSDLAYRTIAKLANRFANGDLDAPSHVVLLNKNPIPVLTFRERLDALQHIMPTQWR